MEFIKEEYRIFAKNEDGKMVAEITFPNTADGICTIDHTFVDETLRGKGIANKLVEAALQQIEESKMKAEATCSYAKHWLDRNSK